MLNELYDLAQSLKAAGVTMPSRHRYFKDCGKGTSYFAMLDSEGNLARLDLIRDKGRQRELRKWMVSEGDSFPAFNIVPLLKPRSEHAREKMSAFIKKLASNRTPDNDWIERRLRRLVLLGLNGWINPTKSDRGRDEHDKVGKCLSNIPQKFAEILGEPPSDCRAISEIAVRAQKTTADKLYEQIKRWIIGQVLASPATSTELLDVLFFHSGAKPKPVSLVLELVDQSEFELPANHRVVYGWIISRLMANDCIVSSGNGTQASTPLIDAYAMPAERLGDKMPEVKLDVLGKVKLRAMSKEAPCQFRYGVAESDSFPVGTAARDQMHKALTWIGDPDRLGKTWCDVSTLSGKSGLLFAYPSEKPEVAPELAGLIVGLQDEGDPDGARFEACAGRVTTRLTKLAHEAPSSEVRVFVLTKPDGRRTKVLYSGRYSVDRLLASAEKWKASCRNVPNLKIRRFGEKKSDKPLWADLYIPYPAEVVSCLNTAWERSGTHAQAVPGFGIGDGLGLLLESGPVLPVIATRAMRTVVVNSLSLLLALGQAHHQACVHPMGKKHAKQALLLPCILGLLLAKLGRSKGDYMRGPPFLVGRLMSLADQLHVQYCHGVRKGQIPPQLVGNALMATALEQPRKAVDLLAQRILPYQAWARTVQGGDEVRLAKYFLGELGRLSAELKDLELPATSRDGDKAEMLLGYLASPEKTKENVDPPETIIEGVPV
jgi:hypothetical protein